MTQRVDVAVKRIHDSVEPDDGFRVLVDRVWPRGVSKQRARLDAWARDLAPSDGLRRWFGHAPERFAAFRGRYRAELAEHLDELAALRARARAGRVTLLFAARDRAHNNAVVLADTLREPGA